MNWIHIPLVKALGWALVHFIWEGALIALALAAVLAVCRRAQTRYCAACIAMLLMFVAFAATLAISMPAGRILSPSAQMVAAAGPSIGNRIAGDALGILLRIQLVLPWVVQLWMLGALLVGLYRLGGWFAAQRMRRTGVCAATPIWQERLERLTRRIGVSKPVILLESSLADVPMVIGFLRPAILIPAGLLAGFPVEHLEAILLHELAHIRRFDYLVNLMQTGVESLLFYHPAVWWVSGLIRAERENCCDDAVVAIQENARGYAEALVTLEERRVRREPALAATGGKLMNRIRRLLNQPEEPRAAVAPILSIALLFGLFCLVVTAQQQVEGPYRKWMNEDVTYIIRDDERAAFQRLPTDEERQQFIKQFWLRRDPTPATPENEAKEEHYRRIAYANDRFAAKSAGWTTDRGRVYIVYGPPDEIEKMPDLERWLYRHIEGMGRDVLFEFADPEHAGEFRLKGRWDKPAAK